MPKFHFGTARQHESIIMDEAILVKESLTKDMIKAGTELIRYIDKSDLNVQAYLWMYLVDLNRWRIVIVSPEVQTKGPMVVYKKLQSVLSEMPKDHAGITLDDLTVVETDDRLITAMRTTFKNAKVSGLRISKYGINGHFVEDAYIYRLNKGK
ncbi:MAG: hypothetical protein GY795_36375 [Desulfobacterales bacterium]|nr:hypothetical protein [Desulfobacterales bacterium]